MGTTTPSDGQEQVVLSPVVQMTTGITSEPPGPAPFKTLDTLQREGIPLIDRFDLAYRLKHIPAVGLTEQPPLAPLKVGDRHAFWVTNTNTNKNFRSWATLRFIGAHFYFWIGDGISYHEADLKQIADTFDLKIYPTNREHFGSEWIPGVDGDPRLYILYVRGIGGKTAGYFDSVDELPSQVHRFSNAHEIIKINADTTSLSNQAIYGTLAHEFQHLIQWNVDRNEEGWMNEGFSMLAELLNGAGQEDPYDVGGSEDVYSLNPDVQLNDWEPGPGMNSAHYGASFLFMAYFMDRFGENGIRMLAAEPTNGLEGVDRALVKIGARDLQSGHFLTAEDIFADWVAANILQDAGVGDGRYQYRDYPQAPRVKETETVSDCPLKTQNREVHQYAVDTIRITCPGRYHLKFAGSNGVGVTPVRFYSGDFAFWSNKGDESDMVLTRHFDFSQSKGPLTLTYQVWYDLETDFDYAYLEASLDGKEWQILSPPACSTLDPSGNNLGCAYNGQSNGWVKEVVDLSQFAGQRVQLRFEYVTDGMVNGEGLLLDDMAVPEIEYFTDFEQDDGGWQAEGFVRIQNLMPQTFRVSLVEKGQKTSVQPVFLLTDQTASIPINIGGNVQEVVLIISGTSRFTRQPAAYEISIDSQR
jgi:immune inhibitor A